MGWGADESWRLLPGPAPAVLDPILKAFVANGLRLPGDASAQRAFLSVIDQLEKGPFLNLCRDTCHAIAHVPQDAAVHAVLLRGFASMGDMQRKRVMGILNTETLKS